MRRTILDGLAAVALAGLAITSAKAEEAHLSGLIYSPWTKICFKESCFIGRDGHFEPDCGPVVSVALITRPNDLKTTLHVTLPARVSTEHSVHIAIDQSEPIEGPFVGCFANGCLAGYDAGQELIDQLKHGHALRLEALDRDSSPINLIIPLDGFADAYDGASEEPKVSEMTTKQLQAEEEDRNARCGTAK